MCQFVPARVGWVYISPQTREREIEGRAICGGGRQEGWVREPGSIAKPSVVENGHSRAL